MAGSATAEIRSPESVGVVVIGRNEGDRLARCLDSVLSPGITVVYVDSGSTDDSTALAQHKGAIVEQLSMATEFTAARARNAGFRRLRQANTGLEVVQFVDGDSVLRPGWLARATDYLRRNEHVGAVGGRLRELNADSTIYNRLCDCEFRRPGGECRSCDGIFAARVTALEEVGLFDESVIAGEEPELCHRLRTAGWRIVRLADEMAFHDAAMTRFGQWWRRRLRGGHAFAEAAVLYGAGARSCVSAWLWTVGVPVLMVALWSLLGPIAAFLLLVYPLQVARVAAARWRSGEPSRYALLYATFCLIGKVPELMGQIRYAAHRLLGRRSGIIEYKTAAGAVKGGAQS